MTAEPNLASLWHDASEEPRYEEFLLAEESSEFNVYKLSGQKDNNSWELLVSAMGIIRWAYIDDLLPKQFGNSEQLKRDEKMIWFLVIMLILLVCGMMKD